MIEKNHKVFSINIILQHYLELGRKSRETQRLSRYRLEIENHNESLNSIHAIRLFPLFHICEQSVNGVGQILALPNKVREQMLRNFFFLHLNNFIDCVEIMIPCTK